MRQTVDRQLSTRSISKDDFEVWSNREALPVLRGLLAFANQREHAQSTIQTAHTGVYTTIWTEALPENAAWSVSAHVVARAVAGGAARAMYQIAGLFFREAGGAVVQEGATSVLVAIASIGGFNAQFAISGNDLRVQVLDDAVRTVNWTAVAVVAEAR